MDWEAWDTRSCRSSADWSSGATDWLSVPEFVVLAPALAVCHTERTDRPEREISNDSQRTAIQTSSDLHGVNLLVVLGSRHSGFSREGFFRNYAVLSAVVSLFKDELKMKRGRLRSIRNWVCGCCLLVLGIVVSWKQGWLPIELVDAETGRLRSLATRRADDSANTPDPRSAAEGQGTQQSIVVAGQTEPESPVEPRRPLVSAVAQQVDTAVGEAADSGNVNSTPETVDRKLMEAIDQKMQQGDYLSAHRQLSEMYWKQPTLRKLLKKRLDVTARSIYSAAQPHYIKPYIVQPGDQLRLIARKYEVPWEYLAKLNRTDPKRIRPGQKLKVIKGPFSAVVSLSRFELTLHAHGYYVHQYKIGIGKPGTTPVGRFTIQEKLRNPTYYGPDGVVAADNPENPLGERWLGLGDGYGIHGTIAPASIGRAVSRGGVRMHAADVAEVYDLLEVGSEVIIRR